MQKNNFEDLINIMKILRKECPWDKVQTHQTLKRYLIEETYEVLEALDLNDDDKIKEELGDLLLQIVFHSEIASEENRFDVYDVITTVCDKMKKRHTHVFGEDDLNTPQEVLNNWDKIKMEEKSEKTVTDSLKGIPKELPALLRSYKVQEKAARVGFDWDNVEDCIKKVYEELNEFEEARKIEDNQKISEELGDLLFAVVNVSRFYNINPEEALTKTINKFITRFSYIEEETTKNGNNLTDLTLKEMDFLWEKAKKI
ncbi:nucleoside triphosphate pyrophosphohydrolase [Caldicellulosiruptoraceae bacterium PP1]